MSLKKPGIYILLGADKRYIGQASNAIFNRLQQHYINKPWWNKLIFFLAVKMAIYQKHS